MEISKYNNNNLKGIIFDFDGVIAESIKIKLDVFVQIYKELECNVKQLDYVRNFHLKNGGLSRRAKFKHLHYKFFKVQLKDIEINKISDYFSEISKKKLIKVKIVKGFKKFIKIQKKLGLKLFISSAAPIQDIYLVLVKHNIFDVFDEIFTSPQKKSEHFELLFNKYNFNPNQLIFFGDSKEDIKVSQSKKVLLIFRKHNFNKDIDKISLNYIYNFQKLKISLNDT